MPNSIDPETKLLREVIAFNRCMRRLEEASERVQVIPVVVSQPSAAPVPRTVEVLLSPASAQD